ncbi:TM9 protein A [Dictyostelium discoideum AX4]|uniref:Putative phagocytic receptor 1a n=1 Tax=Dictyostelium discoideum TaxID=44689 RepID=PHG1A_DICDI|nr:TM9 protein A [Dictyostelium discoideum AX4]Q55FP0.1 RecName: Full=Putative phagocytic receptor 1a; Flags: Precursor [Dictyostelium discoideum]EAL73174.1 TM9 protein A [Dictyostelium discoideum AX4]|eukprot:XP_647493.1 TM9 protein A [Dictyostelium discoideum AX4]
MKINKKQIVFFILFSIFLNHVNGIFYLPGMIPHDFAQGEEGAIKVNKITSVHTQIPYKYYQLPGVCQPKEGIIDDTENLGEILLGDRIENSDYTFNFLTDGGKCKVINSESCSPIIKKEDLKVLEDRIQNQYRVHWLLDGLPVRQTGRLASDPGFDLGFMTLAEGQTVATAEKYLNNHLEITIFYHSNPTDNTSRIVGFEIFPTSRQYKKVENWKGDTGDDCPQYGENFEQLSVSVKEGEDQERFVLWTYEVKYTPSPVLWNKRWDIYFESNDNSVHWFSILNSLMIVFILTVMVAMIIIRTLKKDIRRYTSIDTSEDRDSQEETGWKMIHGDVFRPPSHPMLLSVCIGSGVQIFSMTLITMIFAVLGFLSPANIGGLATALIVLFVLSAMFAGYFSTRVFTIFKGRNWKKNTIYTALSMPGIIFGIFFFVNMFLRGAKSSAAVPFGTFASIIAMWFGISVPLVFLGSYFASKKPVPEDPVRTNQIPRQVPDQIWYMNPYLSILMGGILPFGAVFIELHFILTSLWDNQFYYIFGFLFIVLMILIVTSAEISIVMCYFQLCAEDHHWWWRSFLTAGSSSLYMFIYSVSFFRYLGITKFISSLLDFSYSFIMSLAFAALTGTIGFYSCYFLVRKIYSSIHIN